MVRKNNHGRALARSVLYVSEPGKIEQNRQLAVLNPRLLLRGDRPRLIDEWQLAPQLWDSVRFEVDHNHELGGFILTGSSVPADRSAVLHSGTRRFGWIRMWPMSLWESGESTGEVSLETLFSGADEIGGISELDLERIAFAACRGGWPLAVDMNDNIALDQAYDYLAVVEQLDIQRADGVERDPARVHRLLRSKTAIRTSDTRYFTDPSIAAAALGVGPFDLMADLNTFGLVFETLCMRDLRVFAEVLNGTVYHYRDKNGLECDAVVHLRDGRYGLVEVKLGGDKLIREGADTLLALSNKIDTTKMKQPSFFMVLTAVGPYAYRREDGVFVVPIGCLKD